MNNTFTEDTVRVLRVLEYVGSRSWLEKTLQQRGVKGKMEMLNGGSIAEAIIGEVPTILSSYELPLLAATHRSGVGPQSSNKPTMEAFLDNMKEGVLQSYNMKWLGEESKERLLEQLDEILTFINTP